jgi:hypothetical protein
MKASYRSTTTGRMLAFDDGERRKPMAYQMGIHPVVEFSLAR